MLSSAAEAMTVRRPPATLVLAALALVAMVGMPTIARAAYEDGGTYTVEARDNFFAPEVVRIPVGGTLVWTNTGRNPHTVTADDGSVDSGNMAPGATYERTFHASGAYPYYCVYHGSAGLGMAGTVLVGDASLPGEASGVGPGREEPPAVVGPTIRVPTDRPTIQSAVDHAQPGALIIVQPGVYHEAVKVTTPFLTIRGTDRNRVILDGDFERPNGIFVFEADGVAIQNMTARRYLLNGFYWSSVNGYHASYLTAYDNGDYGVYAYDSQYGRFDHSYASGSPDSGFYIGQCHPCHAVITDVLAENNALGFSGTNASGDLYIVNSEWRNNLSGIVPNTLDSEELPPQRDAVIAGNWVHDNNNLEAPAKALQYPTYGMGIVVGGGRDDLVTHNLVENHATFGIVVIVNLDRNVWVTADNEVRDNVVRGSGRADLALGAPSAGGDCFAGNRFDTSLPPLIQAQYGCGFTLNPAGGGDPSVTLGSLVRFAEAQGGGFSSGDWKTQPAPPPQPNMPEATGLPTQPAVPGPVVPGDFEIRDARRLDVRASVHQSPEVTVMGVPLATTWWGVLLGLYGYVLPLVLYSAWVSIALWDLVRQDAVSTSRRAWWMAGILLVPGIGPVAYYALGRSPIPRSLRLMLVVGGLAIYLAIDAVLYLIGSS